MSVITFKLATKAGAPLDATCHFAVVDTTPAVVEVTTTGGVGTFNAQPRDRVVLHLPAAIRDKAGVSHRLPPGHAPVAFQVGAADPMVLGPFVYDPERAETRFYFPPGQSTAWAADIPGYLAFADADPGQAEELFRKQDFEKWVRGSLERDDLADQIGQLRLKYANDPSQGWNECRALLASTNSPASLVRAVTAAVQADDPAVPALPALPPDVGSANDEGGFLADTITAVLAAEVTGSKFAPPAPTDPPGQHLNAAVVALLVRLLAQDAATPTTSTVFTHLQTGFGKLAADAASPIRTAVEPELMAAVSTGFLHDPVREVARADLKDATPAGFWATLGDAAKDVIVGALWPKVLDMLVAELNKAPAASALVTKLRTLADGVVENAQPTEGGPLVQRFGHLLSRGAATNPLAEGVDGRINRAVRQGISDPVGSAWGTQ